MAGWVFRDFVDHRGKNLIHEWLHSKRVTTGARFDINTLIRNLELHNVDILPATEVKALQRKCKGLYELKITHNRVQYRPVGYYGPGSREFTVLIGAREKGDEFDPRNACETAFRRKAQIEDGSATTCEHDFS